MDVIITQIIKQDNNIILKDILSNIVGVLPSNGTYAHPFQHDEYHIYLSNQGSNRNPIPQKYKIDSRVVTLPSGTWTQTTLLQELADNYLNQPLLTAISTDYNDIVISNPLDSAGKVRTSQGTTINEYSFVYDDKTIDLMSFEGTGTKTHVAGENGVFGVKLSVQSGQYCVFESIYPHYYAKGKSQKHEETFQNFQLEVGVIKKVGYYSSNTIAPYASNFDGMYIESNGDESQYYLVLQRDGNIICRIPRNSWDDPLDGTGYSGLTIDFSSFIISDNDFLWLGGKGARWRFAIDGKLIQVHEYKHAGDEHGMIMKTPNQPIRYEIRSTTGTGYIYAICAEVETEGALNSVGLPRNIDLDENTINANDVGIYYALIGIRLNANRRNAVVNITGFGAFATTNDAFRVTLFKNPALNQAVTWQSYNNNSALEYFIGDVVGNPAAITITGGEKLKSFGISQRSGEQSLELEDILYQATRQINGTSDIIVVAATPLTPQLDITGQIDILERTL